MARNPNAKKVFCHDEIESGAEILHLPFALSDDPLNRRLVMFRPGHHLLLSLALLLPLLVTVSGGSSVWPAPAFLQQGPTSALLAPSFKITTSTQVGPGTRTAHFLWQKFSIYNIFNSFLGEQSNKTNVSRVRCWRPGSRGMRRCCRRT